MALLALHEVSKSFGALKVIDRISLTVAAGETLGILGPNGAGKTTLFNLISGDVRVDAGRVEYAGSDITALPPHRFCAAGIAIVPEGRRLFASMTVRENLDIGSMLPGAKACRAGSLEAVLALFPALEAKLAQSAGELSGGQQQMVAIGRALMARPRLLLLDEPSLGLSPLVVRELFGAIERINGEGTSVLLVEQNAMTALRLAHRAYVLEEGRMVADGTPAELVKHDAIRRTYLGV